MKAAILILTLLFPALRAAETAEDHFRLGESALNDELWDVAAIHFGSLLNSKASDAATKSGAAIRLAEALVRGGKAAEGLELLEKSFVAESPELPFWKGQALAALGRYADAVKELEAAATSPLATEAALTRSALLLSLNQPEDALAALEPLAASPDPSVAVGAKLRRAAILLETGKAADALAAMPMPPEVPEKLAAEASFLRAHLALASGRADEAAQLFSALLVEPSNQSLVRFHAAAIGFADALAAQGSPAKAAESILAFLQEHPDSPLLEPMFSRLLDWLPEPLGPNHPTLDRLASWSEPATAPQTWLRPAEFDALFPVIPADNRLVHSLFTRGLALKKIPDPVWQKESDHLLMRLILEYPEHPLVPKAMLEIARRAIDSGRPVPAFAFLDALRDLPGAPLQGGEAAFLKARAAYEAGSFDEAAELFAEAAENLDGSAKDSAWLNSAISGFRHGGAMTIALEGTDGKPAASPELQADLELERALSAKPASAARTAIEDFLTRHPKHPRVPEARLAAADAALAVEPPDLSMARAQLDTIAADPAALAAVPAPRLDLTRLRLTELSGDPVATEKAAKQFLETYPNDPSAADASLTRGLALFRSGSYNDARMVLEKLAANNAEPSRGQAAWLLAARAAALVGTPSSRDDALILFDNALKVKGTLDPIIMMEKADLLISTNRLTEASTFIRKWYHSLPAADPLRIPAGLLFGQAATPQGGKNPEIIAEALGIYDELLKHPETKPALVNRIQYLRGMALEQLPSPKNPAVRREGEALDAYYSVLYNSPNPPAEWEYLERSGLRALDIVVKAEKWTSAIAIAKKIAEFNGPNAQDAAKRARDIQLKNGIWED